MSIVQDPDIVTLYNNIHDNPKYLDVPSDMTFAESPLHIVASKGRTGLALEILRLKPSPEKKLNLDGLSPLHLALGNGHTNTVRRLVKHDPELIRVQGREGINLLHYIVEKEEIDLLIYFLLICPFSIFDLTVRDETAVHIAVRNENLRAFKVLFGWAKKTNNTRVLQWRNEEGNTLMHLAALTDQRTTAMDILKPENVEARKILISAGAKEGSSIDDDATICENYLKSQGTIKELFIRLGAYMEFGLSGDMRNAVLVVVVLIATAMFQAILTPPFGISHNDTTSTNSTSTNFNKITSSLAKESIIFNSIAFGVAMGMSAILMNDPLQIFLSLPLALFSASYAVLAYGIYPGYFILVAVVSLIFLPFLVILPWTIILLNGQISGDIYHEYDLDEVKYLVFGCTYSIKGPIEAWMAERKASR